MILKRSEACRGGLGRRGAGRPPRAGGRCLRRWLAAGLVPVGVLVTVSAYPKASLGTAAASSAAGIGVDFAGSSAATTLNLGVCSNVQFTANGITGHPPLVVTWDTDLGEIFPGNPISLNTASYIGSHRVTVHVTNAFGAASLDTFFQVDALAVPSPVATSPNPTVGLNVSVAGVPVGATD